MRQRTEAAPEVLLGLLIALGMFFIHSLVDFPMFEVGPMFLLASLLGAAIGFRSPASEGKGDSAKPRRRARLALAICGAGWLVIAVVLAVPVISAEADAKDGDDLLRNSAVDNRIIPDRVAAAADRYEAAFRGTVPNSSYATRAALAWNLISQSEKAKTWFDAAIAADPGNPANYSRRAEFFAQSQPPDYGSAVRDMTRSIQLDPINRLDRLRLATFLENAGQPDEAMAQIFTALELNDRLTLVERRRLTADQFRDVPPALARLTVKRLMRGN
jgi:tetratricopeptide (TPR) repeat protein